MLELRNVSFSYSGQTDGGLRSISLCIPNGECVLLCGRSGCGKTTVTRLINGLIPNFYPGTLEGEVLLDGKPIAEIPMYQIAGRVGSVFQNPRTQFFNVDTDSEIAFGIENKALPPIELSRRVRLTSKELGIEGLQNRNIFQLSGGEKQKIAFASVYAMNPDVYLLDEPSSNLDMASIRALGDYVRLIKSQGKTILIAEHRLYYLMEVADRIVYLEQGEIAGSYTPREFCKLSGSERRKMGLRAIDLREESPECPAALQSGLTLELKDVSLFHKKRIILEHISLKARQGEVIGVAGYNGAGKTTFSRALCGLHKECSGSFLWNDEPMNHKKRLRLSYLVMQDVNYQLFAESVEAECTFGIKNPDRELTKQTMEELGLLSFRKRHPNTLSGGQKQRVAAAVSLISGKELLIFDEPTSGLDYDSMAQVGGLIRTLAALGKIVFVVTHDYEFICRTCTRVLHFNSGKMQDDFLVSTENETKLRNLFSIDL